MKKVYTQYEAAKLTRNQLIKEISNLPDTYEEIPAPLDYLNSLSNIDLRDMLARESHLHFGEGKLIRSKDFGWIRIPFGENGEII